MSATTLFHMRSGELATGRPYLERDEREPPWYDKVASSLWHGAVVPLTAPFKSAGTRHARAFLARVDGHTVEFAAATDEQLRAHAQSARVELRRLGFAAGPVARCFALVREAATRVIGQRHFESQLIAGWWLLHGTLVEMATGEGKTLAATLPACAAALAGTPVHVITVNDYLAERDAHSMGPVYHFLGLRCCSVVHGLARPQRRAAYADDVVYVSNKELAFDYLRDRAALGDRASRLHLAVQGLRDGRLPDDQVVLRGLVFGIVDEADSVFIDEARTPLILSAMHDGAPLREKCEAALSSARALASNLHFEVDLGRRRVRLTDAGLEELDRLDDQAGPEAQAVFSGSRERNEMAQRALEALCLYSRDEHYVLIDGKVQIVDASTGRVMPDRAWEQGLHQMIEAKEGVELTGRRETLARITYQRLFRRYLRLAGMTGTATEVAAEIGRTYGLRVVRVPLHKPLRRNLGPPSCLSTQEQKWRAVADAVAEVARVQHRPVLIGTRTVRASEQISALLHSRGLAHVVLNAKQDRDEAQIVAMAGEAGRVTVATNMAGRGTDIVLGEGVAERGGLHVILTEFNESRRIDRQLFGRSARLGDPGSGETIVAADDELFVAHAPRGAAWIGRRSEPLGVVSAFQVGLLRWLAQGAAERRNRDARETTLKQDRRLARLLAFSGRGE